MTEIDEKYLDLGDYKSALMTEEEITLALFLYPVGNALFTLISGFVSDKFGRKVTIVAMSCSALTCYLLFIFSGMFKWTPYLTGFAIGGFMGSYWGAGDTIGGIMFSESTPTNLRSSVTVINTLLNGVMGGLATVITMILLPIIPERMFGYMYLGLTVPGLVGAIVIMWLFVGETRGLCHDRQYGLLSRHFCTQICSEKLLDGGV